MLGKLVMQVRSELRLATEPPPEWSMIHRVFPSSVLARTSGECAPERVVY